MDRPHPNLSAKIDPLVLKPNLEIQNIVKSKFYLFYYSFGIENFQRQLFENLLLFYIQVDIVLMTGCSWLFPNLFVQHLHQQHDSSMDDPQMRIFSLHWTQPAMPTMLWFSWYMNLYGFSLMVPRKNGYETYRMTDPMRVWCSRAHQLLLHCFKINPQHSWWCYSPHQGGGKVLILGPPWSLTREIG